ncbi:MAG: hypothetical protein ACRDHF_07010 [Tepidiformaceae bacterium]
MEHGESPATVEGEDVVSELSLVPWMSGERPYLTLELEMQVDGEILPEPCNRASLRALVASSREPGTHFIFTCSCGDAGCGGFFNGIDVAHEGERITWTDGDWTYSFVFDSREYRGEVDRARELSTALLEAVTDERVVVDGWDRSLFPEWNETTELVMRDWDQQYQRRRGLPDLPGEHSGSGLYLGGCLIWPWLVAREMYEAMRSEPRETIGALPAVFWYTLKEQRKTEWRWLRKRLGHGQHD